MTFNQNTSNMPNKPSTTLNLKCLNIEPGKLIEEFKNWSELYKVEFDITITKRSSSVVNAFNFATGNTNYGSNCIPALWIYTNYLSIRSTINGFWNLTRVLIMKLGRLIKYPNTNLKTMENIGMKLS